MKLKYLPLLLFFVSLQLISQDYEPIIKEGSFWDVLNIVVGAVHPPTGDRYKISGDTIINNISYKKLQKAPIRTSNENNLILGDDTFINADEFVKTDFYLRENIQEKKVYIFASIDNNDYQEYTYCDFNLNIGDEMENPYLDPNFSNSLEVKNIYQDSNYNKTAYDLNPLGSYIQAIGKITYPFQPYQSTPLGDGFVVPSINCYGNDENQNGCATVLNINSYKISSLKFFPNPVQNFLSIKNSENSTFKIYSITGKLILTDYSNTDIDIDLSNLKKSVYLIQVSNTSGNKFGKFLKI